MTHDELLASIIDYGQNGPIDYGQIDLSNALRAVMELHVPINSIRGIVCRHCFTDALHRTEFYPCPTIQAIEAELK